MGEFSVNLTPDPRMPEGILKLLSRVRISEVVLLLPVTRIEEIGCLGYFGKSEYLLSFWVDHCEKCLLVRRGRRRRLWPVLAEVGNGRDKDGYFDFVEMSFC